MSWQSRQWATAAGRSVVECGAGWTYDSAVDGPATADRTVSECYPYTALVGAAELGYDSERPKYKRKPPKLTVPQ